MSTREIQGHLEEQESGPHKRRQHKAGLNMFHKS
jgi:hypothetical protein